MRASTLPADLDEPILRIQRDLFALGAMLADPSHRIATRVTKATLGPDDVARLEALIDRLESELPPLRHFVLAGRRGGRCGAPRRADGLPSRRAPHGARSIRRRIR